MDCFNRITPKALKLQQKKLKQLDKVEKAIQNINSFEWTELKESKYNPCKRSFITDRSQVHDLFNILVLREPPLLPCF